jgi:hypothetical protein
MLLSSTLLTTLALAIPAGVVGVTLEARGPQTDASCSSDFGWADNSKGFTPCLVAAQVQQFCVQRGGLQVQIGPRAPY